MKYKISLDSRLNVKANELEELYPDKKICKSTLNRVDVSYSLEDEIEIMDMKSRGVTDKEIALKFNRSYWGMVDKIRRLKQKKNEL